MAFVEKGTEQQEWNALKLSSFPAERPWSSVEEKFFVIRSGGIKRNGARVTEQLNRRVCPPRINRVTKLDFRALSFNPRALLNRPQRRSSSGRIDEWKRESASDDRADVKRAWPSWKRAWNRIIVCKCILGDCGFERVLKYKCDTTTRNVNRGTEGSLIFLHITHIYIILYIMYNLLYILFIIIIFILYLILLCVLYETFKNFI